jgi:histone-lysine N-methyltransferase SETMAR
MGDNARLHTAAASEKLMEENGMARAPHPPYSPDLAPSDLYLFGHMKHRLRGQSFEAADELFSASEVISIDIDKSPLDAVFLEWMERLGQCIPTNSEGNHFHPADGEMLHLRGTPCK